MSRQYKRNTGETLGQYVTREKMKKAAELLISTNKSIGDIGLCLGFSNFAHFSKCSKKLWDVRQKNIEYKKR